METTDAPRIQGIVNLDLYLEFLHVFLNNHQWKSELQDFVIPSVKHSNYSLKKNFNLMLLLYILLKNVF